MTHPIITECYCISPETEKKKEREREKEREDIQLISCEFCSMTKRKNGFFLKIPFTAAKFIDP